MKGVSYIILCSGYSKLTTRSILKLRAIELSPISFEE